MRYRLGLVSLLLVAAALSPTARAAMPPASQLAQASPLQDEADGDGQGEKRMPEDWPSSPPPLPESMAKGLRPVLEVDSLKAAPSLSPEVQDDVGHLKTRRVELDHKIVFTADFFTATQEADFAGGRVVPLRDGRRVWIARLIVPVEAKTPLMVSLEHVHLPPGSSIWTYTQGESLAYPRQEEVTGETPTDFEGKRTDGHSFWMGPVGGPVVDFQIAFPASARTSARKTWGIVFARLSTLDDLSVKNKSGSNPPPACFIDAMCVREDRFKGIERFRTGVGLLLIDAVSSDRRCTASLIKNKGSKQYGYILTARHCMVGFRNAVVVWDFFNKSCNGERPNALRLPNTEVQRAMVSSVTNDFALLRLKKLPKGRRHYFDYSGDSMVYQTRCGSSDCKIRTLSFPKHGDVTQTMRYSEAEACFNCSIECPASSSDLLTGQDDGYKTYYARPIQGAGDVWLSSSGSLALTPEGLINGHLVLLCRYGGVTTPCQQERSWIIIGNFLETFRNIRNCPGFS